MKSTMKCMLMLLVLVTTLSSPMASFAREHTAPAELQREVEFEAFMEEALQIARASVTPEQIAAIGRMLAEEEAFFANLTPESLWDAWLLENPDVFMLGLSEREMFALQTRVVAQYEMIAATNQVSPLFFGNWHRDIARAFSSEDGLNVVTRSLIEGLGALAVAETNLVFPGDRYTEHRRDAFRHYFWNFMSVQDIAIGITQAGRIRSTRIYTTNYELARTVARFMPELITSELAPLLAEALAFRQLILDSRNFVAWSAFFNLDCAHSAHALNDIMDLYNNEMGRRDGASSGIFSPSLLSQFNSRWSAGTLVRNLNESQGRKRFIFDSWLDHPIAP